MKYSFVISMIAGLSISASVLADNAAKEAKKAAKAKALSTYKSCDMKAFTDALQKNSAFKVSQPIQEKDSYYYEVKDVRSGIYNTDFLKSTTCDYVMKNSCYVYWNNLMSTGKIAPVELKSVIVSPPVNLLSPLTGCKKNK